MRKRRNNRGGFFLELAAGVLATIGLGAILMGMPEVGETERYLPSQKEQTVAPSNEIAEIAEGMEQADSSEESFVEADTDTDFMEVHFIDVGQADATLIKCGDAAMLIDAGEGNKGTALQLYLTKQGVEELDYLILTHPDADHIGGAAVILTKFDVDTVFMSDVQKDNRTYEKLLDALEHKRLDWSLPQVGELYSLGDADFQIVAPNRNYEEPNNASIALVLEHGDISFLFTGDAEEIAERDILANGMDITADVYKVGHHGSRDSSDADFLDAISPKYAVISCGADNPYGHPHAEVMNALRERDIKVFRTDEQGSIVAISDGVDITWNAAPSDTWKVGE